VGLEWEPDLEWEPAWAEEEAEELAQQWVAREAGWVGVKLVALEAVLAAEREPVGELGRAEEPVAVKVKQVAAARGCQMMKRFTASCKH